VALPLLLVATIWGSTWIVITGQIGDTLQAGRSPTASPSPRPPCSRWRC
jgi:hypothetical protein